MVYCNDDPLMAKRLEECRSMCNYAFSCPYRFRSWNTKYYKYKNYKKSDKLPLIIDAGLGQASDAAIAMELGCDGVLANTAIAKAKKTISNGFSF